MFDLDLSKLMLVAGVALVATNPKDLPAAMRTAGRALGQLRQWRDVARKTFDGLIAETSLEAEVARVNLALNHATAMRGSLGATPAATETTMAEYASPQMQAYLAPLPEAVETTPCASPSL